MSLGNNLYTEFPPNKISIVYKKKAHTKSDAADEKKKFKAI